MKLSIKKYNGCSIPKYLRDFMQDPTGKVFVKIVNNGEAIAFYYEIESSGLFFISNYSTWNGAKPKNMKLLKEHKFKYSWATGLGSISAFYREFIRGSLG